MPGLRSRVSGEKLYSCRKVEISLQHFDLVIIGAGIIGCSVAWRLARTGLRVALLENGSDLANGATRANSGILHSGIHENPDTDVFQMCRQGLAWYKKWAAPLDFCLVSKPTLILAHSPDSLDRLKRLQQLHVNTLNPRLFAPDYLQNRYPFLAGTIKGALKAADSAQISPYETCRAIAENAIANGLKLFNDCDLISAERSEKKWHLLSTKGHFITDFVIIAAGSGSNSISSKLNLSENRQKLISGVYFMMNKSTRPETDAIFFGPPSPDTKGILLQNTVHGNLMLGPDSIDRQKLADDNFNWQRICSLWQDCLKLIPGLERRDIIRTFTGERVSVGKGFQLENHLKDLGIIRLDGIKSPGLTAAPAIADRVINMLARFIDVSEKEDLQEKRLSINSAVANMPAGEIICRCERVFASQIREAISRGADNIESLRWQTRAGMGDCQGSFCRPALIKTLKTELNLKANEIFLKNRNSPMFSGDLK